MVVFHYFWLMCDWTLGCLIHSSWVQYTVKCRARYNRFFAKKKEEQWGKKKEVRKEDDYCTNPVVIQNLYWDFPRILWHVSLTGPNRRCCDSGDGCRRSDRLLLNCVHQWSGCFLIETRNSHVLFGTRKASVWFLPKRLWRLVAGGGKGTLSGLAMRRCIGGLFRIIPITTYSIDWTIVWLHILYIKRKRYKGLILLSDSNLNNLWAEN